MYKPSLLLALTVLLHVLVVQHTAACDWRAELLDLTSKEIKEYSINESPVIINLLKHENGVNVMCLLHKEEGEKSYDELSKVEIECVYPDNQIIKTRAVNGLNFVTKRIITLPANLSFSSTTQGNKTVYTLTVDCK